MLSLDMNCTRTVSKLCVATLVCSLVGGFVTVTMAENTNWQRYSDAEHGFALEYPDTTHPEKVPARATNLVSAVAFNFQQNFQKGPDGGTLKFRFQISVWQNTNHLSSEEWAKQNTNPQLTTNIRKVQIAGREGTTLRTSNLAWQIVKSFVAEKDWMYELSYDDVAANTLLTESARVDWAAVLNRMIDSFRLLSEGKRP
jgi:hypothetical protein